MKTKKRTIYRSKILFVVSVTESEETKIGNNSGKRQNQSSGTIHSIV
jgi:hypothetical protein